MRNSQKYLHFIRLILFISLIFSISKGYSQQATIKARVISENSGHALNKASLILVNQSDSVLVKFSWSQRDGNAHLTNLHSGMYILKVSYPGMEDLTQLINIDVDSGKMNLGTLRLQPITNQITEVVIQSKRAMMTIRGDTIEFDSKSFKIEPSSKVEEMLRQIPGMEVDDKGRITANGKRVDVVLLNGEEFFGDDPTLITRNIRGDMVDKIQLYERNKRNQDPNRSTGQTLNIQLKEDKNRGVFGKVLASAGVSGYYDEQAIFNLFRPDKKFSVFANYSTIDGIPNNTTGRNRFGFTSLNRAITTGGILTNFTAQSGREFYIQPYNRVGRPSEFSGGIHYDHKFGKGSQFLNADYVLNTQNVDGIVSQLSINNLNNSILSTGSLRSLNTSALLHNGVINYRYNLSKQTKLEVLVGGTSSHDDIVNSISTNRFSTIRDTLYFSERNNISTAVRNSVGVGASLDHTFKNERRTFSFKLNSIWDGLSAEGSLYSRTRFFSNQQLDSLQLIEQVRNEDVTTNIFALSANYVEPLWKNISLSTNFTYSLNQGASTRSAFNKSATKLFDQLDPQFSSDFKLKQSSYRTLSSLTYLTQKWYFSFRTGINFYDLNQIDRQLGKLYHRKYYDISPNLSMSYSPPGTLILLSLGRSPSQPGISQIQPIAYNNDPLNIIIGNAELRTAFVNAASLRFDKMYRLSGQSFSVDAGYSSINNPIIDHINVDSAGVAIIRAVNLPEQVPQNFNLDVNYSFKIAGTDIKLTTTGVYSYSNSFAIFNSEIVETKSHRFSPRLNWYLFQPNKINFNLTISPNYTRQFTSSWLQLNNSGFNFSSSSSLNLTVLKKWIIGTSASYNYSARTQAFDKSFQILLLNASLTRAFFKDNSLKLSLSGRDLLNQNTGFERTVFNSIISERQNTTIQRYLLISLNWDFNRFGKAPM